MILSGELEMDGAHPDGIVDEASTEDQVEMYMEFFLLILIISASEEQEAIPTTLSAYYVTGR